MGIIAGAAALQLLVVSVMQGTVWGRGRYGWVPENV